MKKTILRVVSLLFVFIMLFASVPLIAFANSIVPEDIENSDISRDLLKMEAYSKDKYPIDETVDYCDIVDFIEYGYDYSGNTNDYGLYLYIYNPSCKAIDTTNNYTNKIQLRAAPIKEETAGGDTVWVKYSLKFLDKTSDNLFYKFKVEVPKGFMSVPDKSCRIYQISDVEFLFSGEDKQRSVGCSGEWIYSGYQEYHGLNQSNTKSNLSWKPKNLMTLDFDIHQATWKTKTSDKGNDYAYELSSAYFNVPNSIIREYGNSKDATKGLVEIKGYYNNAKIRGISTADESLYALMEPYIGLSASSNDIPFGFKTKSYPLLGQALISYFYFNGEKFPLQISGNNLSSYGMPFRNVNGIITSSYLSSQIQAFRDNNKLYCRAGSQGGYDFYYSVKNVDEYGNPIDLADSIETYASNFGSFGKWLATLYGYGEQEYDNIIPIVAVSADDITFVDDQAIAKNCFISEENVAEFKSVVNDELNDTTFLFRFAVTDYYCSDIFVAREGSDNDIGYGNGNYYFEKEVFLDFDVLSLTWEKENGVRTVIPVKASPIDIVGDITPVNPNNPDNSSDKDALKWLEKLGDLNLVAIIGLVLGVIAVVLVIINIPGVGKFIGGIFNFLLQILLLPFKLIAWLFEKIFIPDHAKKTEYKYKSKLEEKKSKTKSEKTEEKKE